MDSNSRVLQYAADLFDAGIIKNKGDFLNYFRQHGEPGEELQAVQQVIHDYCMVKMPPGVFINSLDREAEILCRLFPKYELKEAKYLLNMFTFKQNRMQLVMCIMSLHNRMFSRLANAGNGTNAKSNVVLDVAETLASVEEYINNQQPQLQNAQVNTYSNNPTYQRLRRLPTATVVRPEDLDPFQFGLMLAEASGPIVPNNDQYVADSTTCNVKKSQSFQSEKKVTCKPIDSLVESPTEDQISKGTWDCMTPYLFSPDDNVASNEELTPVEENGSTWFRTAIDVHAEELIKSEVEQAAAVPTLLEKTTPVDLEELFSSWARKDIYDQGSGGGNQIFGDIFYQKKAQEEAKIIEECKQRNNTEPKNQLAVQFLNGDEVKIEPKAGTSRSPSHQGVRPKIHDMPLPKTLSKHRRHGFPSHSSNSPPHEIELPKRRKYQRLDNLIVLNDDSDSSDMSFTDIDDENNEDLAITPTNPKVKKSAGAGSSYCIKLSSHIMEMFPDACPLYIRNLCTGRKMSDSDMDDVLQIIFNNPDYPKRDQREPTPPMEMDLETQAELLKEIFPEADPTYLESRAQTYLGDPDGMRQFITKTLENRNYPTKKDYVRRQQISAQVKQYTTEFDVDKFLEIIPDPVEYFNDMDRRTIGEKDAVERHLCLKVLKNLYPHILVRHVSTMVRHKNLMLAAKALDKCTESKVLMKSRRKYVPVDLSAVQNIPLLQEVAFLSNRELIILRVEQKKQQEQREREEAKANGLLQTCNCCYDDEVMLKDCAACESGCNFCKSCVQKSVEVLFAEGKTEFPCLGMCQAHFNLRTLMDALPPKLFSKVAQRKQLEEVKAAGLDDLAMCPFCDFATIPPPGDKIFKCLNPECMKESCRECKEPSHVPLRCDEVEKDDDVKKRTYIENKMTEALVRVCYQCGMKFIKEDGCNKMTCSCGAKMCYLCLAPVVDYTHFNGQGGDKHHLCPLYSDTNSMHEDQVLRGAAEAKQELGVAAGEQLKIDPSADVEKHYAKVKAQQPMHLGPHQGAPPPIRMVVNAVMEIMDPHAQFHRIRPAHHHHHHHHPDRHRHYHH